MKQRPRAMLRTLERDPTGAQTLSADTTANIAAATTSRADFFAMLAACAAVPGFIQAVIDSAAAVAFVGAAVILAVAVFLCSLPRSARLSTNGTIPCHNHIPPFFDFAPERVG